MSTTPVTSGGAAAVTTNDTTTLKGMGFIPPKSTFIPNGTRWFYGDFDVTRLGDLSSTDITSENVAATPTTYGIEFKDSVIEATATNRPNHILVFKGMEVFVKEAGVKPIAGNKDTYVYQIYKNRPGMMWVDGRGSNIEMFNIEVKKIALNNCGQWVEGTDPTVLSGTTGWYKPYKFVESQVIQLQKQKLYNLRPEKVPKPRCHKMGPICQTVQPKAGIVSWCGNKTSENVSKRNIYPAQTCT